MKRIISVILAMTMLFGTTINVSAHGVPTAANKEDAYTLYEDDEVSMIITELGNGEKSVAWLEKSDPSTVYQWTGEVTNQEISGRYMELISTRSADAEVFNIKYYDSISNEKAIERRAGREDDVIEAMEDVYGTPRVWRHVYTSPEYTSPVIKIREDDYVSAFELGLVELPAVISESAAAISLAEEWGIPVPTALHIYAEAVSIYEDVQAIYEVITLDAYRGTYVTTRTGTATPVGGNEIPVQTATRSRVRVVTFLDTPNDDYVMGDVEIIYAPSEYKYQLSTLADDTYDAYVY